MTLLFALSLAVAAIPRIIFVGNSHTQFNDVPGTVTGLLSEQPGWRGVEYEFVAVGHLNDGLDSAQVEQALRSGSFTHAVLQGATISSSHKYSYSQKEGIELARRLTKQGAKIYFVSEWPRRGWDETGYIEDVYREMAKATAATVIPVGRVWDSVLNRLDGIELWQPDGNHATASGSTISARTIARWLSGRTAKPGADKELSTVVDSVLDDFMPPKR